jgi:uncharacterized protein YndB with AHSA1/START domain
MKNPITVSVCVEVPLSKAWHDFTDPEAIVNWNAASEDWHTTRAENDVRVGGRFVSRMEAKDGSEGFDFSGTYDEVIVNERIAYSMDGGRTVAVTFAEGPSGVTVTETFEPETENAHELQRLGWQSILDSFKKYSESTPVE